MQHQKKERKKDLNECWRIDRELVFTGMFVNVEELRQIAKQKRWSCGSCSTKKSLQPYVSMNLWEEICIISCEGCEDMANSYFELFVVCFPKTDRGEPGGRDLRWSVRGEQRQRQKSV